MSERARKVLERWRKQMPPLAERGDVEAVLETFLPGAYRRGGKEPWVVEHEWLRALPSGRRHNFMPIAMVKGRQVKASYINRLVSFIELREWVLRHYPELPESEPLPQEVYDHYESER